MRLMSRALLLLLLVVAPVAAQRGDPIARLEAARARSPQSVPALRALGIAYYKAQRFQEAAPVLDRARTLDPRDGVSALYAGLAAEALNDLSAARRSYEAYLEFGVSRRTKDQIRARLVSLSRLEAVAAAKAAVANEAQLAGAPGSPLTIAVPPLTFRGTDTTLKPLERGLAELLITDLSRSAKLTVVERDRMQALADEIALGASGAVDSGSAVRAGRLMRAGTLVNGLILQQGASGLTLDARLVTVADGRFGEGTTVTNTLDALFAMEKQLAFGLFERLGVQLTPAERQLVERRPTTNLNAFLAYSRGLQASDDGRFEDAAKYFDDARSLDPGFGLAAVRAQSTSVAVQAASTGVQVNATSIEASIQGTAEAATVAAAVTGSTGAPAGSNAGVSGTLQNASQSLNPPAVSVQTTSSGAPAAAPTPQRDASTSTTAVDTPVRTGTVTIIIRRP
ncbi:MAG: tetratricopeptide repeat protein [Gemmatimonadota bacterium]|jgi:tetratricopeptide (TPR) repeat protein|nr:tetratricopeptide repeat protein [Gemmatimonadota bacterium]MDQ8146633.1 tetratricopeptide repeat protein [Gemmatimonadota bacterium]MDQ8148963.1 tetratricopeptide repeat protein [Gemmatimonadota bacterium]MDQ8156039.1 tetratricopeptide repeat protein [Gemmatimonadota bacterium]MDQ8175987.1 tetratricopeptide repeat protein [Gemmatimonadota bacterium]